MIRGSHSFADNIMLFFSASEKKKTQNRCCRNKSFFNDMLPIKQSEQSFFFEINYTVYIFNSGISPRCARRNDKQR